MDNPVRGTAPMSAHVQEADLRRTEILEVAKSLFSRKGYKATTMAEIASCANLSVGTLYKFFKDKYTLYSTLVAKTMGEFERESIAALRDTEGDAVAKLHRYIEVGAELFAKHLAMIRVYFSETGAAFLFAASGLEDDAYAAYKRIVEALTATFRAGIEEGRLIDLPPEDLARGLEGVHNAYLSALVRDSSCYTPAQIAALTKRVFFETVIKA